MSVTQKKKSPLAKCLDIVLPDGKFWTHAWSLVDGCTPVSPGCRSCWLAELEYRFHMPGTDRDRGLVCTSKAFNGRVIERKDRLDIPLKSHKKRHVWAVWSDLFHDQVTDEFRDEAFARMATIGNDYFMVVTKRPEVAARYFSEAVRERKIMDISTRHRYEAVKNGHQGCYSTLPLGNVIILVTMEDQKRADERAPFAKKLASMGWTVGALCEPLLGPLDLSYWPHYCNTHDIPGGFCINCPDQKPVFSWVITGGETGRKARPNQAGWSRDLREFSKRADIPFMFKNWGDNAKFTVYDNTCGCVRPKTLDGREHLEVPNA